MANKKTDVKVDNEVVGTLQEENVESQKVTKESEHDDAFVSLRHIDKIYDNNVQAVFDFNLDIKKHEFIVFVGPSGCGKSTLLNIIDELDKNYRKEEVKEKKEIRLSTRPTKMDFDSVRNKAFGDLENDLFPSTPVSEEKKKEKEEVKPRNINRLYDMTNKDEKPSIEKVTLGEADEYFRDLGLAYNTDYKDISKDISDGKIPDDSKKKEKKEETLEDNLFDLIESMYDKED